ncbi:MAG TPA: signal peptidase I [Candidatus Methylomirabilis sp.]|nr:signal peptidase I [Candidatus Methylomirabilis sp.]
MLEYLKSLALAVLAAMLIRAFLLQAFYIPSGSMQATLFPGDYILVNRFVYNLHPPRRGDIVVFPYPRDEHWDFVKRVIGLPGDVVDERGGRFRINGKPLSEPYVEHTDSGLVPGRDMAPLRVPKNQLFVLGDNRDSSLDSRYWGTVNEHKVIGEAFLIYWSRGTHWYDIRWNRIGRWLR